MSLVVVGAVPMLLSDVMVIQRCVGCSFHRPTDG